MSAGGIKAGSAYVEISARTDKLRAELAKGRKDLSSWSSSLAPSLTSLSAAFAGVTAAAAMSVREFAKVGSEINDVAMRTGLATDQLQDLKFAAAQSGASLADVEAAAKRFVKGGGDIRNFEDMGRAMAQIGDESERSRRFMDEF